MSSSRRSVWRSAVGSNVNVSPRFGILTSVTYVPSDLKLDLATGQQVKDKANLLFGSARATFYVLPITAPSGSV